jgi:hypothetical protein
MTPENGLMLFFVALFFTVLYIAHKKRSVWDNWIDIWVLRPFVAAFCAACISGVALGLTVKKIEPKSLILAQNGAVKMIYSERGWLWKWDQILRGAKIASYASKEVKVTLNFLPITLNPKVRQLKYEVKLETIDTPACYLLYRDALGRKGGEAWLKFQLYEFNEKSSAEIAKLYNPLDDVQQQEFIKLLRSFLGPKLKDSGMSFRGARFDIL